MKNMIKSLIAAIGVAFMMTGSAFAATTVKTEAELKAAIAVGGEITLGSDIAVTEMIVVSSGVTATLDLNGKAITVPAATDRHIYALNNKGVLTIMDSVGTGSISSRGIYNGYDGVSTDNTVAGSKLTVEGGTFYAIDTNGGASIFNCAEVVINGGVFDGQVAAFNGRKQAKSTINGGTFRSVSNYAIQQNGGGELTIINATVDRGFGAVGCYGGKTTIKGGTFLPTGIEGKTSHVVYVAASANVTINGGTFKMNYAADAKPDSGEAVASYYGGSLCISGGEFYSHFDNVSPVQLSSGSVITGGKFMNHSGLASKHAWVTNFLKPGFEVGDDGTIQVKVDAFGDNTVFDGTTYYATLQAAVEVVCGTANATLYCKPGADVGSLQHAPVTATLTIYGNGAYVSGGAERDFDIGNTDPSSGKDITADMTLTVKDLEGCGAWGAKATDHTVNLVFEDCQNMGKVFITGMTGTLNITIKDSSFEGVIKEAVYSNADGAITLTNVDFSNLNKAVNLNHKAAGTQTVTITDCSFVNCGADVSADQIPVRVLSSVDGGKSVLTVSGTTFSGTPTGGADILLDYGIGETTANISTAGTAANVVVEKMNNNGTPTTVPANTQNQSFATVEPVAKIGETPYKTFAEALTAAKAMTGDVTVEIYEKVTLNQALAGNYSSISFVGKDTDAEIYLDVQGYITATGKKVNFTDLKLSKSEGGFVTNAGFMNVAFGIYDVAEVNYTNCTFLNGACASFGTVKYTGCTFKRSWDKYALWAYGDVDITVDGCTFADYRGIKMFAEGKAKTVDLTVKNSNFSAVTGKPAIVLTSGEKVTLEGNTYSDTGVFELDLDGVPNGTPVTSDVSPTCVNDNGACGVLVDGKIYTTVAQSVEVATATSTVTLLHNTAETVQFPIGVTLNKNGFEAVGITVAQPVAKIGDTPYSTLQAAVAAAQAGDTVVVIGATAGEAVVVDKDLTITGEVTLTDVSINGTAGKLSVSNLTFVGNSWINAGGCDELVVENVTANVAPSNASYTNSRSAFIGLGRNEGKQLKLAVTGCNIVVPSGSNAVLGWAAVTEVTISGNTFGSETSYQNSGDIVKFMAIADGAVINITNNTSYSNYNGFVFAQNTTRDNRYAVYVSGNTFYGNADHIWIEISGGDTVHAKVEATSDNTVNGNKFTATDIKYHYGVIKNWDGYAGVDVVTDADGKVIGGTLAYYDEDFVAEGYVVGSNGSVAQDPLYGKVAKIGDKLYASIADAVSAAVEGDTITLLSDVEQTDGVLITDKKLTINLNEKTFTVSEGASTNNRNFKINGSSEVTITNGTLVAKGELTSGAYGTVRTEGAAVANLIGLKLYSYRGYGLNVKACTGTTINIKDTEIYAQYSGGVESAGGTINLTNVKIEQTGVYSGAAWCSVAIGVNGGGKVVVNSGTYSAKTIASDANAAQGTWVAYVMSSGGTLEINDGTFNGVVAETATAANACGIICADAKAVVEINGGTFNSNGAILDMRNNTGATPNPTATLKGGTYSADPRVSGLYSSNLIKVAEGYVVIENDGVYTVAKAVAKIGDKPYTTIAAAIAAAKDGDTVTILAGEYAPINISNKNITLQGTVGANGELLTVIKGGNPAISGLGFNGTIKDIKIVDAFKVMYAEPAGNVTVDNIYVTGATYGLHLVAYAQDLNWTIQNSYMDLAWANSFGMYGAGDAAIVIKGNEFASTNPYYPDYGAIPVNTFLPNITVEGNVFGENTKIKLAAAFTDISKINISKNYHADGVENAFADDSSVEVSIRQYYTDNELKNLVELLTGAGTEADPFVIATIEDLKFFRDEVNGGTTFDNQFVKMTADIDLNNVAWAPIGSKDKPFKGTFDGDGKTVSNLVVDGGANQGFFGYADNCEIKNLKLANVNVKGTDCVGAVAGQVYSVSTIDNCHVSGNIKVEGQTNVGGIVGKYYVRVTNSSVIGDGVDTSYVKGVYVASDFEGDNVGGIMGHGGESNNFVGNTVKNITISGTRKVGGIVGTTTKATNVSGATVENVVIATTATAEYSVSKADSMGLGGLIGHYYSSSAGGTLSENKVNGVTFSIPDGITAEAGVVVGNDRTAVGAEPTGVTVENLTVQNVTGATQEYLIPWDGVTIANLKQLKMFRDAVNAGDTYAGKTVTLTADIDLGNDEWTPIAYMGKTFKGTFDGNGKTISNLKIADEDLDCAGLFGYATGATIKNVNIKNVDIKAYSHAAPVVGHMYTGNIENCHVSGSIKVVAQYAYAAGITADGYVNVRNCSVIADEATRGVITVVEKTGAGGITGWRGEGNLVIENCTVKNLDITAWASLGGISGIVHYNNTVKGCVVANVTLTKTRENGQASVGLVCGNWEAKDDGNYTITVTDNTFKNITINGTAINSLKQLCGSKYSTYDTDIKLVERGNTYDTITSNLTVVARTFADLKNALAYADAGETITLLADIEASEVLMIGKSVTIKGDNHKVTSSASRVFRVTTSNTEVTLNDVNMVSTAVRVGTNDIRGISIDNVNGIKLTLNNCSVDFTDTSANDWAYAVNVTGGSNHTLTVNGGTYEGANVINVRGTNHSVTVQNATLNCTYPQQSMYEGACVWVQQENGSSVTATGNTFNGSNAVALNIGTGTSLTESGNTDNTVIWGVAKIGDTKYATLAEAYNAAQAGDTITLLDDVTLTGKLTISKDITIDGNGHSIIANHTAFILETSSDCEFKNITLNTNNKAKGVKIASGNVIFDNVTIPNSNKSDAITVYGTLTIKNYFKVESTYQVFDAKIGSIYVEEGTVFDFTSRIGLASPADDDLKAAVDTNGKPYFCAYGSTTYYRTSTSITGTIGTITDLTLLDDVSLNKDITVKGTLDLNGKTLTLAEGKVLKTGGNLTITGGTFAGPVQLTKESHTLTAPEGVEVTTTVVGSRVVYADGKYTVQEINYVAKIGETKFESVSGALDYAYNNNLKDVVIMLCGVTAANTTDRIDLYNNYGNGTAFNNITFKQEDSSVPYYLNCLYTGWTTGKVVFDGVNIVVTTQLYAIGEFEFINNSYIKRTNDIKNFVFYGNMTIEAGSTFESQIDGISSESSLTVDGGTYKAVFLTVDSGNTFTVVNGANVLITNYEFSGDLTVNGVLNIDGGSTINAVRILGAGKIVVDATDMAEGDEVSITANLANFTGTLETVGNDELEAKIVDDKIVLVKKEVVLAGAGTEANPFLIKNIDDLVLFRNSVNAGETKYNASGVYVALGADIDMAGVNWVGIGSASQPHGFMGNFDGKGFKIQNLTITDPALDSDGYAYAGLFSITEGTDANNQNIIKNLTIENVTISTTGHIVSAAIAYPYYTIVDNVKVCGNISITGGDYTAGALAYTRRCVNASNVSVVGNDGSTITGAQTVGGVISDIQMNGGLTADYSNFVAENLTITGTSKVGGISGIIATQTLNGATVKNVTINCSDRAGQVAGSFGGTCTISNIVVENVAGADAIIGATYKDGAAVQAKVGDTFYATLEDALKANGNEVTLLVPYVVEAGETVVLDLNGKTVSMVQSQTVGKNHEMIHNYGNLTIQDTVGGGKISYQYTGASLGTTYAANTISTEPGSVLTVKSGTIENLTYDSAVIAYAIDGRTNGGAGDVTVNIEGGTITSLRQAIRIFANSTTNTGTLNISGGEMVGRVIVQNANTSANKAALNITGGTFNANSYKSDVLYVGGSNSATIDINASISGGTFNGAITETHVQGFIFDGTFNSKPKAEYCAEGFTPVKVGDKYSVGVLPDADVTNLGAITVGPGGYTADMYKSYDLINSGSLVDATVPYDLTLAMDFKAKDTAEQAAANKFGGYTTDFFIKMEGMSEGSFVGDGCYLAGYYPSYKAWVKIPLNGFTVEDGKVYPVITSAGFDFKYTDICSIVGQFICGIYLTPEVLAANPNLKVNLTLGLSENKEAALNAQFEKVDGYVYDADDLMPVELPEVEVVDIKSSLKDSDPDLTFALNFKIKDADKLTEAYLEKLFAKYGDYYTDYVLTISGLSQESVKFNANGNADGYLAGQYDAWSENWVSVPFSDVTIQNGQSLYIMEYAAQLMGKQGLRFTLAEVAEIVQNFDCGVYFTPEFLAANPNLKVDLELKVFTEDANGNKVDDISVATNEFDKDDFGVAAVVAENTQTKYFASLADAIAAANGKTVELLANVDLGASTIKIPAGMDIALDLNGKVISGVCNTSSGSLIAVPNTAKLTVMDSSDPSTGKITYAQGTSNVGWTIYNEGNLVLNSGTIELTGDSWSIGYAVDLRPNAWGVAYANASVFEMNGGNIVSSDGGVRVASSSYEGYSNVAASFVMNGGKIDAAWDGVFIQQSDVNYDMLSFTMNGGTIESDLNPIRVYGPAPTSYVADKNSINITLNGGTCTYTSEEARDGWVIPKVLRVGGGSSADSIIDNGGVVVSESFKTTNPVAGYTWVGIADNKYILARVNCKLNIKVINNEPYIGLGINTTVCPVVVLKAATNLENPEWASVEYTAADDDVDEYFWVKPTLNGNAYRFFKLAE